MFDWALNTPQDKTSKIIIFRVQMCQKTREIEISL